MKKKIFAVILDTLLVFSLAACSDEPAEDPSSSEPESFSSQGSSTETESSSEAEEAPADDVEPESSDSQKEPAASSEQSTRSQAPVQEQQPDEQPVENEPEEEPVAQEPTQPVTQPSSQSEAPAASSQDDPTAWTQEKVDNLVAKYREVALDRGWEEAPELNINGNGAWGNPWDTRNTRYDVLTKASNIEEFLYGLEFDIDRSPEEMSFNIYVEDEGDYWVIYFIFAGDMK